jgi:hypothetical protein
MACSRENFTFIVIVLSFLLFLSEQLSDTDDAAHTHSVGYLCLLD